MNTVKTVKRHRIRRHVPASWIVLVTTMCLAMGCHSELPTPEELAAFADAGPSIVSGFELNEFLRAQVPVGPYHVVPGDLLLISMPDVMSTIGRSPDANALAPLHRRVRTDGTMRLPGLGQDLKVEKMTIGEVEEVIEAAYEKEIINRPSVVVQIADFDTVYVSVGGLGIREPGLYRLRSDERSLSALLMRAGGIVPQGAVMIRVRPPGIGDESKTLELPVRDERVPLEDVLLSGGEAVEVVPLAPAFMTIVGQVAGPGRYPIDRAHPPLLIEALATAGGVREIEDPRYVSVFRKDSDGDIMSAKFSLAKNTKMGQASLFHENGLGDGAFATVKPGDVIVVQRTLRSRTRQFVARAFRVSVSVSAAASGTYYEDLKDPGALRGE